MNDHDDLLREVRIRASLLMKSLARNDAAALARVHRYLSARKSKQVMPVDGSAVKRRTALEVVAQEFGHTSYAVMRELLSDNRRQPSSGKMVDTELFFRKGQFAYWNNWYADYADAVAHRRTAGGYLFPYRHQFVVVEADFLVGLGVDPTNADWAAIGFDWVKPQNQAAFERLSREFCALGYGAKSEGEVVR